MAVAGGGVVLRPGRFTFTVQLPRKTGGKK